MQFPTWSEVKIYTIQQSVIQVKGILASSSNTGKIVENESRLKLQNCNSFDIIVFSFKDNTGVSTGKLHTMMHEITNGIFYAVGIRSTLHCTSIRITMNAAWQFHLTDIN